MGSWCYRYGHVPDNRSSIDASFQLLLYLIKLAAEGGVVVGDSECCGLWIFGLSWLPPFRQVLNYVNN